MTYNIWSTDFREMEKLGAHLVELLETLNSRTSQNLQEMASASCPMS
jgi:hypothetical protein